MLLLNPCIGLRSLQMTKRSIWTLPTGATHCRDKSILGNRQRLLGSPYETLGSTRHIFQIISFCWSVLMLGANCRSVYWQPTCTWFKPYWPNAYVGYSPAIQPVQHQEQGPMILCGDLNSSLRRAAEYLFMHREVLSKCTFRFRNPSIGFDGKKTIMSIDQVKATSQWKDSPSLNILTTISQYLHQTIHWSLSSLNYLDIYLCGISGSHIFLSKVQAAIGMDYFLSGTSQCQLLQRLQNRLPCHAKVHIGSHRQCSGLSIHKKMLASNSTLPSWSLCHSWMEAASLHLLFMRR